MRTDRACLPLDVNKRTKKSLFDGEDAGLLSLMLVGMLDTGDDPRENTPTLGTARKLVEVADQDPEDESGKLLDDADWIDAAELGDPCTGPRDPPVTWL